MRKSLVFIFLLINGFAAGAQVFAFVVNNNDQSAADPATGYKKQVATRVFEQLLRTNGDFRLQQPALVMNRRQRYVAWMNADQVQIGLEEKAYDICASFGKDSLNAMATLLAHELTHYYEKHDWKRHFAMEHENLETARQLERLEEGLKQETQADYLGGFLALAAGFRPYGIMPDLLKKIYQGYGLPMQLPGYPHLNDRLKMVDGAQKKLGELSIAFEIANRLTVVGQYETAASYQRYLLQDFQSRELFNNAASSELLAALDYFSPAEMPYVLPVEIDADTRLKGFRNNDTQRLEKRAALLKSAAQQLDMSLTLDAQYTPAMLNKASLYVLQGEMEEAEYWLKKGRKLCADANSKKPFDMLQAVCKAIQGETDQAVKQLTPLGESGYPLATTNLNILQKKTLPTPTPTSVLAEQIENYRLTDFLANPTVDQQVKVSENVFCGIHQKKGSTVYIHYADNGAHYTVWQETGPDYAGTTQKGISLKSNASDITKAYGNPTKTITIPSGEILMYAPQALYFYLNTEGKVVRWGVMIYGT